MFKIYKWSNKYWTKAFQHLQCFLASCEISAWEEVNSLSKMKQVLIKKINVLSKINTCWKENEVGSFVAGYSYNTECINSVFYSVLNDP